MGVGGFRAEEYRFHNFYVGGCSLYVYLHKKVPRVFVCDGPPQVEPENLREMDVVEIEALAERLNFRPLNEIAEKRRDRPLAIDLELAVKLPAPNQDGPSISN